MTYIAGQWKFTCDVCGFEYLSGEGKLRWDNARVCENCWEPRHPQDFVKAKTDKESVPWSRPEPPDTFIEPAYTFTPDPPPSGTF